MIRLLRQFGFEIGIVGISCIIVIIGCFSSAAVVTIDTQGSSDTSAMATAVPEGPPPDAIHNLRALPGEPPYSIDTLRQATGPDLILANKPPSVALTSRSVLLVDGWAIDGRKRRPAQSIYVTIDRTIVSSCPISGARPDVAATFHDAALGLSGFDCVVASDALVPGHHRLGLDVVTGDRKYFHITTPTAIDIP